MHTDLTVLIESESGTGKELAARAIHDLGQTRNGAVHSLDLATSPPHEVSKELFGSPESPGLADVSEATIYLDEVGI